MKSPNVTNISFSNNLQGFLDADNAMLNDESLKEQMAGTTAITVLIKDEKIYCANAGDSRAIGCKNGEVESLSFDHKPNNPDEMDRIYRAGGYVELNRVNGNLALSRALGDFVFKKNKRFSAEQQIVTGIMRVREFFFNRLCELCSWWLGLEL